MKVCIFTLFAFLLPLCVFSQSRKPKGPTISATSSINFYQAIDDPYQSFGSYIVEDEKLKLTYLTANSGTFVVEEGKPLYIERTVNNHIAFPVMGLGASVQIRTPRSLFHELSLTKLSRVKGSNEATYITIDSLGRNVYLFAIGFDLRATALGLRYDFGKYFGDSKSKVRFGLSGGLESSAYFYKMTPKSQNHHPAHAKLLTVELSLNPILALQLSKKVALDFKLIPNVLLADFGGVDDLNPAYTERQRKQKREYQSPELSMAFSMMLRYVVKEPKR